MIKKLLFLLILPFLVIGQNSTFVPDDAFENLLISLGYDDVLDNFVLTENIIDITDLNLSNSDIVDLTGINSFENLVSLTAYSNNIFGSLELILPNLTSLGLFDNGITNLDISQCENLQWLDVQQNLLSSIDVSNNTNISQLFISSNLISELDLTNNIELSQLVAANTLIEVVDLSMLYNLNWLDISSSNLKSIILPNTSLDNLNLGYNYLTEIDLSNISNLGNISLNDNLLLNLDLLNNSSIQSLYATNNLFNCIAIDSNLDEELFYVDDNVSFSNTCDYNDSIVGCMNNLSPNYNPEANYDDNSCNLIEFQADNYNYTDLGYIVDGCFMDVVIPDNIDFINLGEVSEYYDCCFNYTILAQNSSGDIYGSINPSNFSEYNYNTNDYKVLRIWQGDSNEEGLIENQEITFVAIVNGVEMLLSLSFDMGSEFFNCNSTAIVSELEVIGPLSGECPQAEISLYADYNSFYEYCSISSYVFYNGPCVGNYDTCGNGYPNFPYNSVPSLSYSWYYEGELLTEVYYPNSTYNTADTYSIPVYSNGLYTFVNTDALGCVTTQDVYIDNLICSFGCMDENACNFDSSANSDNNSCEYLEDVNLGEDITTCEESIILDAGEGYDSYLWSTEETTQTITVTESDNYSVNVESENINNYALWLDGVEDCVEVQNNPSLDLSTSFTLSTKIRPNWTNLPQPIISTGESNVSCPPYALWMSSNNTITGIFYSGGGSQNCNGGVSVTSNSQLQINTWYDVSVVVDQTEVKIYINGDLDNIEGISETDPYPLINNLKIGKEDGASNIFRGWLDNIQIWNIALEQEIIQDYTICPPTGEEDGLVAYWNFEEGPDSEEVIDLSPNNNNGMIQDDGEYSSSVVPEQLCEVVSCSDSDAITITFSAEGCTDELACNYDSNAICDDESCEYIEEVYLGEDIETCDESITLDAGEGYDSYSWSTGETSQTISVNESGNYSATVGFQNNYSMYFDGINDYISVEYNNSLDLTNNFTLSAKIKVESFNSILNWLPIFHTGSSGDLCDSYFFYIDNINNWNPDGYNKLMANGSAGCGTSSNCGASCGNNMIDLDSNTGYNIFSNSEILEDNWYDISFVYSGTQAKFYINGILDTIIETNDIDPSPLTHDLWIGREDGSNRIFNGWMDNLQIWNVALNDTEIIDYINVIPTGTEEDLVGYWNFEEGSDSDIAIDLSPMQNHGNIYGATYNYEMSSLESNCYYTDEISVTFSPEGCTDELACNYDSNAICNNNSCEYIEEVDLGEDITTCEESVTLDAGEGYDSYSWSNGETSPTIEVSESGDYSVDVENIQNSNIYSMIFDGDDYVTFNQANLNNETLQFSYSLFINANDLNNNQTLLNVGENTGGIRLRIAENGIVLVHNNIEALNDPIPIEENQWYYLTATYNNGTYRIYLNADLIDEGNYTFNSNAPLEFENTIAPWSGVMGSIYNNVNEPTMHEYFSGKMDNVSVWNTELSQEEIQEYMSCPPTGNELGLVGYWNFEEGPEEGQVLDLSVNGNNGTINGTTYNQDVPNQQCETSSCNSTDEITIIFNICGCTDLNACNYNSEANEDDDSCEYILDGECDCDGNILDCAGVCGGNTIVDECGVCDGNNDTCLDCCGVINGDGTTCNGVCGSCNDNTSCLDECGVPNGDNSTCAGCIDETACNYDIEAIIDDGSCINCASVDFADNSNYVDLDNINFDNSNGVTISLWVHDDDFTQNPEDVATYIDFGSQDSYRYAIRNRSGKIEAFFEGDGIPDTFNGNNIDWSYPYSSITGGIFESNCGTGTDGWHNITAVYCATGIRLYIDGKIAGQSVTYVYFNDFILTEESVKRVGLNQSGYEPSDATIDEVRIWNRALSTEEVAERSGNAVDINGIVVGVNDQINLNVSEEINLVGYWKFDCSYVNEITSLDAVAINTNFSTIQHCNYTNCSFSEYSYDCTTDLEGNTDCNSCDPPEGCTDELACNYDPLAVINIQANCFYIDYYCPFLEYPEYYDCECKCINDIDEDSVCDELDCSPENYNPDQDCTNLHNNYINSTNKIVKTIDILGRELNQIKNNTLILHIYNDGETERKYLFK